MTRPPIVRLTALVVAIGVLAVAAFAAFYILGALVAVAVCAGLGLGLIALVAYGSAKLSPPKGRNHVDGPLAPAQPPVADPPV